MSWLLAPMLPKLNGISYPERFASLQLTQAEIHRRSTGMVTMSCKESWHRFHHRTDIEKRADFHDIIWCASPSPTINALDGFLGIQDEKGLEGSQGPLGVFLLHFSLNCAVFFTKKSGGVMQCHAMRRGGSQQGSRVGALAKERSCQQAGAEDSWKLFNVSSFRRDVPCKKGMGGLHAAVSCLCLLYATILYNT